MSLTPAEKSAVVQQALMDAARYGKPGDVEKLLAKLKAEPGFVEELANQQGEGHDRTAGSGNAVS